MVLRNASILLAIGAWFVAADRASSVSAEQPSRLPSVVQVYADEPLPAPLPGEPSSPPLAGQIARPLQSEYPETVGALAGPVPVETLVGYALANNPEIQAARYHARALGARVPQAASLPDPQLMTVAFLESIQTAAGPQEVAMSLSQKFPWCGKLALRSQVTYHDAMAAYARVAATELAVSERVKRAYYEVYYLQRAIEVTLALEPKLQDVVEIAGDKFRTGAGRESQLQAEVELWNLRTRLVEFRQAKIDAQAQLAGILHLPPDTRIEAVATHGRSKLDHAAQLLLDLAQMYQPELEARRYEIGRDRASVALARRNYWPDATFSFNWFEIGTPGLSQVATGEDAFSLGVGVNLPLYRSRLDAAVREAKCKTASSARRYAAALDQVHAEVLRLHAQFIQHHRVLEILETKILPNAAETLELSIEAYRVDKLQFQQMIDSYKSLLKFQIDLHKRTALREQVIASLERAVGSVITAGPFEIETDAEQP